MDRNNRLYLVRHGQVNGYENILICGHTDVDVTEVGRLQLKNMAERLRLTEIQAIYSSDLKRSVEGARIIGQYHDAPLQSLPELREMYFGGWEGLNYTAVQSKFPEELKKRKADIVNFKPPGNGESVGELSKRILSCFEKILKDQKGKDILIVGHGLINRVIICSALGLDLSSVFNLQQDYGCLNIIDYFPDSTLVRLLNG